ncbi:MAG: L,D-transpeptidase, partial [Clostridia bacterium]|nr:L,D-transpeptidase [Clostridia bacterium]
MKTTGHLIKPVLSLLFALAFLFAGCQSQPGDTPEVSPDPTPEPVIVHIGLAETDVEAAAAMPTPTPSPEPTETPIPFSHYAPTVNMSYEELVGSTTDVDARARDLLKDGYPDPKTYYIIVDKQWQVTLVYRRIDDGSKFGKPDYDQPVRYMLCSTGNPDKEYGYDTTSGIWQIEPAKERFWQFVNLEAAQYLTLIHSRTYFHSVLYEKKGDLNSLVRESYDDLGKKASHACIRLTVPDARWMFYNIAYGTSCEIRDGSADDVETASIRAQLILPPSKEVSLKPTDDLWTDNWRIEDVAHELEYKYMAPRLPDMGDGEDEEDSQQSGLAGEGGNAGGGTEGGGT